MGIPDLDVKVIGLRLFSLSLVGDAVVWFTKLPYNSINTWDKFSDVFLYKYYPLSKKLNKEVKVDNFVVQPGESLFSSWDRFTTCMMIVQNNRSDDESLKEYFYLC